MSRCELVIRWLSTSLKGLPTCSGTRAEKTGFMDSGCFFGFPPKKSTQTHKEGVHSKKNSQMALFFLFLQSTKPSWYHLQEGNLSLLDIHLCFSRGRRSNGRRRANLLGIMGLCFVFSGLTNMATGPLVNSAVAADNFVPLLIEEPSADGGPMSVLLGRFGGSPRCGLVGSSVIFDWVVWIGLVAWWLQASPAF